MKPLATQKSPYEVQLQEGKSYWWCACGKSASQPLCDGSHKDGPFTPLEYKAEKSGTAWFCGCRQSAHAPLCDGVHKQL